jgi:ElaB/YqjD/DUF883 family membrane-anchored ribosome-binding protein
MENQVNTIPEQKTPEKIEAQMLQTRESLTEKVAALENQVLGTVQNAADTLTETVDAVKTFVETAPETVSETVENVVSTVREKVEKTFDISSRVQENPWSSVGVSVGVGFLVGYLAFPGGKSSGSSRTESRTAPFPAGEPIPSVAAPRQPGLVDEVLGMLGKKVKAMAETMIDSASSALSKNIQETVPTLLTEATKRFVGTNDHESTDPSFDAGKRIYGR